MNFSKYQFALLYGLLAPLFVLLTPLIFRDDTYFTMEYVLFVVFEYALMNPSFLFSLVLFYGMGILIAVWFIFLRHSGESYFSEFHDILIWIGFLIAIFVGTGSGVGFSLVTSNSLFLVVVGFTVAFVILGIFFALSWVGHYIVKLSR